MPLGPQFKNTYWDNPETGERETFHDDAGSFAHVVGGRTVPVDTQGLLFSPYHGTGLRDDPTIPRAERMVSILRGLGVADQDAFRDRTKRYLGTAVGKGRAAEQTGMAVDAVDSSDLPTHIIRQMNAGLVVSGRRGRAHFAPDQRVLKVHEETKRRRLPDAEVPVYEKGEPIPNPGFSNAVNRIYWDSEEGAYVEHQSGPYRARWFGGTYADVHHRTDPGTTVHTLNVGDEAHIDKAHQIQSDLDDWHREVRGTYR